MDNRYGVSAGVWEIYQDMNTNEVCLYQYGEIVETWKEPKALTWEEMHDLLARKSKERGDVNADISE